MADLYRPRQMPRRFMQDAPAIVHAQVLDLIGPHKDSVCEYDIILRPEPAPRREMQVVGLDFDKGGAQGCHFFLEPHQAAAYRERNRRKRVAWSDLPAPTQKAIVAYLES